MKKYLLLLLLPFSLFGQHTSRNYVFGSNTMAAFYPNLVGYYKFDSDATDLSGASHNGTLIGSPSFNTGKIGNGVDLINSAALNYVDYPDNSDFSFGNGTNDVASTVSFWIKFHALTGSFTFPLNKRGGTSGTDEWAFFYNVSTAKFSFVKFQFNNNAILQSIETNANPFVINTWYHIVLTDKGTAVANDMNLYIDNVLVTVTKSTTGAYTKMNNSTAITRLGNGAWDNSFKVRAIFDELAIWKGRELTAAEVSRLWNGGAGQSIK